MASPDRQDRNANGLHRRIGPYRLEGVLGRGGMGVVYLAYDERLDRHVALKRVLVSDDDSQRRQRLRREARTAAQLTHPAIVQVFDLVEEDDGDWIVMERVAGPTLAQVLRDGPLDVERTLDYGRQIAEGLAAAHSHDIVHRDLKTENVVVLADDRIKILDFGLAKRLVPPGGEGGESALTVAGQVLGTGRAMSPEQARGLEVGPRSDLFSLGILLYESLTGISPFRGESLYDTLARIATHQPPPLAELVAGVPRELSDLVGALLRKAPELRPASAREVVETLTRLAEERRSQERRAWEPGEVASEKSTEESVSERPTVLATEIGVSPVEEGASGRSFLPPSAPKFAALLTFLALALTLAWVLLPLLSEPSERSPGEVERIPAATGGSRITDPLAVYEEGMRAVRRPDRPESIDRALEIFQRRLADDPSSAAAHAGLARAYWEKAQSASAGGDPVFLEQAEAVAREAVRLDPYLADGRVSLGLVELLRGHAEAARSELETALELDPTNADAHYGLAKRARSLGRPEEAERHYRRAIELHPSTLYSDALGALLYSKGRYSEAEEVFLASLELAPDDVHALRNLGGLYYAQGRLDEAAARFQEALKIRPNASLYSNLGTLYFSRGLYAKAAAAFESALGTAGASHKAIYWINLADAYRQIPGEEEAARTSYQRAIRLLDEEIDAAPEDVRLLSRRALVRARAGEPREAQADLAKVRELGVEGDVYSLFRVAVAAELCGRRQQALSTLEEALRSGLALSEVRHEPDLLELRADRRFHLLLMGLDEAR